MDMWAMGEDSWWTSWLWARIAGGQVGYGRGHLVGMQSAGRQVGRRWARTAEVAVFVHFHSGRKRPYRRCAPGDYIVIFLVTCTMVPFALSLISNKDRTVHWPHAGTVRKLYL